MRATTGGATAIDAPSVVARAIVAVVLLIGFYLVTLGVALLMFFAPIHGWDADPMALRSNLTSLALGWIPAFIVVLGVLRVRRIWAPPRGRRLDASEAPALFAMLAELGSAARTAPPSVVYLTDRCDLSVAETRLSRGGPKERVLFVGAPALALLTAAELRAGLAHELGHFAFGDVRLSGVVSFAHASFRALLENTRRPPPETRIPAVAMAFAFARVIGDRVVASYAWLFFLITRRSDRRAELAADQLAKRIAGPHAMVRLLEKLALADALWDEYLRCDVARAVDAGGLPSDLTGGFATFTTRLRERGATEPLERALRERPTDWFDAHPALGVRTSALLEGAAPLAASAPGEHGEHDDRPASALVSLDVDAFLVDRLRRAAAPVLRSNRALAQLPWASLPRDVYAPHLAQRARALAAQLFSIHPEARTSRAMLAALVADIEGDRLERLALELAPLLPHTPKPERRPLLDAAVSDALATLLCGALLEGGAEVDASLGEPCIVLCHEGERIHAADLARASLTDAAAEADLARWARALASVSAA
jgi:Zn-dependent protease with chaperone function